VMMSRKLRRDHERNALKYQDHREGFRPLPLRGYPET
jgi:hypothetical protein